MVFEILKCGMWVTFNGYKELAYLHPNYFKPDASVLNDLELSKDEKFIVLRFVAWDANHDAGHYGFVNGMELIKKLEEYGEVFITSERKLSKDFAKYRITTSAEKLHDLLYYATLYLGEGATMATEAGILGTPSIYLSSLVGTMGNFDELEGRYGLVYSFTNQKEALKKAIELLEDKNIKQKWQKKREKLLKDKIDVTTWMTEFIENYPNSFTEYKREMKRRC